MKPQPEIESLLDESSWLSRLAANLVAEGEDADDLVQETWMTAIRRLPRKTEAGRGFLRRVAKSRLVDARRRDGARRRREEAVARPEELPRNATAERIAAHRQLVEELEQLPTSARDVLFDRYFEGLTAADIARAEGVPSSTIRNRLRRALEQLRGRLDRRWNGRGAWIAVLTPLASSRRALASPVVGATALVTGGILVSTGLKSTLAVIATAGLLWFVQSSRSDEVLPDMKDGDIERSITTTPRREIGASSTTPQKSSASPVVVDSDGSRQTEVANRETITESTFIFALAINGPQGQLPGPTDLSITPVGAGAQHEPIKATSTADGRLELDLGSLDDAVLELTVVAENSRFLTARSRFHLESARTDALGIRRLEAAMQLTPARNLSGRVLGPDGEPFDGAQVASYVRAEDGRWKERALDDATTGADGRYELRTAIGKESFVVAAAAGLQGGGLEIDSKVTIVPEITLTTGVSIDGTLRFSGLERAHGKVAMQFRGDRSGDRFTLNGRGFIRFRDRLISRSSQIETDDGGRFRFEGLAPGPYIVSAETVPGIRLHMSVGSNAHVEVEAPASGVDLDVAGGTVAVEVRRDGRPWPERVVRFWNNGTYTARSDDDGRVEVVMKAGEECEVVVAVKGYERFRKKLTPVLNQRIEVNADLQRERPRPRMTAVLEAVGGGEIEKANFAFYRDQAAEGYPPLDRDARLVDGKFAVERLTPGRWWLVCRPGALSGGHAYFRDASTWVDIPEEGEVSVQLRTKPAGRIRLAVRNAEGQFLAPRCRILKSDGQPIACSFFARAGGGWVWGKDTLVLAVNDVEPALPPGAYRVEIEAEGFPKKTIDLTVTAGETTTLDVTLP